MQDLATTEWISAKLANVHVDDPVSLAYLVVVVACLLLQRRRPIHVHVHVHARISRRVIVSS